MLIRDMKAKYIGQLVQIKAVVTKISEVKPMMQVATYTCDVCACEIYQIVSSIQFTPVTKCTSPDCVSNNAGGRLFLQTRGSKMTKFQEIKVQEISSEVPTGSIPRSLTVCLLGDLCRKIKPGDHAMISGILFPTSTDVMSRLAYGQKNKSSSQLSCDMYVNAHVIFNSIIFSCSLLVMFNVNILLYFFSQMLFLTNFYSLLKLVWKKIFHG